MKQAELFTACANRRIPKLWQTAGSLQFLQVLCQSGLIGLWDLPKAVAGDVLGSILEPFQHGLCLKMLPNDNASDKKVCVCVCEYGETCKRTRGLQQLQGSKTTQFQQPYATCTSVCAHVFFTCMHVGRQVPCVFASLCACMHVLAEGVANPSERERWRIRLHKTCLRLQLVLAVTGLPTTNCGCFFHSANPNESSHRRRHQHDCQQQQA